MNNEHLKYDQNFFYTYIARFIFTQRYFQRKSITVGRSAQEIYRRTLAKKSQTDKSPVFYHPLLFHFFLSRPRREILRDVGKMKDYVNGVRCHGYMGKALAWSTV